MKLPPNVKVNYAPISTCVLHTGNDPHCWRHQETMSILRQWLKLTPHVDMYDYNPGFLLGSFVPERDVANFAENAKLYKQLGMKGLNSEGRKAFMQTWISYYMRGKLLWDSNADVAALTALIAVFMLIPGDQPEKALQKVVDFLAKFSRK